MSLVVGLTGGVGCCKSEIIQKFAGLGTHIIDTRKIGHELCEPGHSGYEMLVDRFKNLILSADGTIDRKKLRAKFIHDLDDRYAIRDILYPLIYHVTAERVALFKTIKSDNYALVVIPFLPIASVYDKLIKRVIMIDCQEQNRVKRALDSGMSEHEIKIIMSLQNSRDKYIDNAILIEDCESKDHNVTVKNIDTQLRENYSNTK